MLPTKRLVPILPVLFLLPLACNHNGGNITDRYLERDVAAARADMNSNFAYMADNAMLRDMALADFHFVAHTTELSGTGEAKLNRFAPLLITYGGTVRYETDLVDDDLVGQRLAHASEYLEHMGCDMDRVELRAMISGGRGMTAREALAVREQASGGGAQQASEFGGLDSGSTGGM